ncbi:MAG: hypothetical protein WA810_03900 [Maribacter sp.]
MKFYFETIDEHFTLFSKQMPSMQNKRHSSFFVKEIRNIDRYE